MKTPRKLLITVGIIFGIAAGAMAADLPKEGTAKRTYIGTYKTTKIGDRTLTVFDENGLQVTDGFADHMTFHCWGTREDSDGKSRNEGYCVGTDPTRHLIESKLASPMH